MYAVTASWQSQQKLSSQSAQLGQVREDLARIKRSFVSLLLDKDPNKSDLIRSLVGDTRTLQGIEQFKTGQFESAYSTWRPSAEAGSADTALVIAAANTALEQQTADASLSTEQRQRAQAALAEAPPVELRDGTFYILAANRPKPNTNIRPGEPPASG